MNLIPPGRATSREPAQRFVLHGLTWGGYEKIVDALSESHVRTTYDRGSLELMSPLPVHEIYKTWFGYLFTVLVQEIGLRIKGCGSATFSREDLDRGLEPDQCYYIANVGCTTDWRVIDLSQSPPPDLAIEIDVTRSSLDRMGIYASLGVPEVWRFDGEALLAYRLRPQGGYEHHSQSLALPFLLLAEMVPLLQRSPDEDDLMTLSALQAWVRTRVVPAWQAASGTAPTPESPA